ncbi:hypothetical protein L218DRAFT_887162 [Marasmius fiardii PR-910]|nr:hypothetical protein L218DRAFT_887162 [Marasmius fiardii PR-910]
MSTLQIEEGIYQIINLATDSPVHTFTEGENVFVALIRRADPGNYGLVNSTLSNDAVSDNVLIFKNMALQSPISVGVQDAGIQTTGKTVPFVVLEAPLPIGSEVSRHRQAFIIKHPENGLVWSVPKLPFIRGHVRFLFSLRTLCSTVRNLSSFSFVGPPSSGNRSRESKVDFCQTGGRGIGFATQNVMP